MFGNRRRLRVALLSLVIAATGTAGASTNGAAQSDCGPIPTFNRYNFPEGQEVTNRFLPWVPGTQFVLSGTVDGAPHSVVTTVTDLTKVIDGVRTIVVLDQDLGSGNVLQE